MQKYRLKPEELSEWELYDMEKDRTETQDQAGNHPDLVKKMAQMWMDWAKRTGAIPRPT